MEIRGQECAMKTVYSILGSRIHNQVAGVTFSLNVLVHTNSRPPLHHSLHERSHKRHCTYESTYAVHAQHVRQCDCTVLTRGASRASRASGARGRGLTGRRRCRTRKGSRTADIYTRQSLSVPCLYQRTTRTLFEIRDNWARFQIRLGVVQCDTDGNKVTERRFELWVEFDSFRHRVVVELVGKHDRASLVGRRSR